MTRTHSVRLATEADFDRIVDVVVEAFLRDPVYNYFGSLKEFIPKDRDSQEKEHRKRWAQFLLKLCVLGGGRVTVLVEHGETSPEEESERIVGVAEWLPPNKRVALWRVRTMVKAGIIVMLRAWGLPGLLRCGFEWMDSTEQTMLKAFQKRNLGKPEATWHLLQIAVLPECQGKGYMSKLFREAFDHAPDAIFTLEESRAKVMNKQSKLIYVSRGHFVPFLCSY
ncbi:hypothetical protein AN958_03636 [Leucoagaricus sp. SymC.cos]|nr:hypothetical protein AN958_03636 [Leucoagaricus sp. SymC.cos]